MLELYAHMQNSLGALRHALKIAVGNADNFNTPGYKYISASFTTMFDEVLQGGSKGKNPMVLGASMTLGSTSTDFSQGYLTLGTATDSAVVGEGFFLLSKSAEEYGDTSDKVYTRAGRFFADVNHEYLVDSFGRKVFGYKVKPNGEVLTSQLVPIKLNGATDIGIKDGGFVVSNYQADNIEGSTTVETPLYKLALTNFRNKQGLIMTDGGAYIRTIASGEAIAPGTSGKGQYGNIRGGMLESSNIDVARAALDMQQLNRGFAAVQGVIDDVGRVIQSVIQAFD
ncbi:flagellar hook basal-body protein [bacterium]|nr:flagellar hook basal-body protein [bacterium]MBT3582164.1 flagellar hook basal-body protein [bacterium]MBT4551845.1 flagellar hook basal-body protein [bacterium]MBT5988480.1 flagellar hook basal-body protein [bacterium]MBT7088361.1 flagellar hook basal-body protein [bacterium]